MKIRFITAALSGFFLLFIILIIIFSILSGTCKDTSGCDNFMYNVIIYASIGPLIVIFAIMCLLPKTRREFMGNTCPCDHYALIET